MGSPMGFLEALDHLQNTNFATPEEATAYVDKLEREGVVRGPAQRQRRYQRRQQSFAEIGREAIGLLGREAKDIIEAKAVRLASEEGLTFSEALDWVLSEAPELYEAAEHLPHSDDRQAFSEEASRKTVAELEDQLLDMAEALREDDDELSLADALRQVLATELGKRLRERIRKARG